MVCCANTEYCSRIEIYRGKETAQGAISKAVIRNLTNTLRGQPRKRLVVTDTHYSSVELAERLLRIGIYTVGTTRINRKGWNQLIRFPSQKKKTRGTKSNRARRLPCYAKSPHSWDGRRFLDGLPGCELPGDWMQYQERDCSDEAEGRWRDAGCHVPRVGTHLQQWHGRRRSARSAAATLLLNPESTVPSLLLQKPILRYR
ncbi:hypothetical protein JG688_00007404 [Phytophthora aleatoria]|uniref:PiggyBac transposable element-derived protein domain-containing protein n=1 Tax=Phytophthora aleatoria TaxID=2496075 RepID=A0A8J5IYG2_9STRA|nr:hypothetical protein JG688_00007404 [Phytophthora aleatoria]